MSQITTIEFAMPLGMGSVNAYLVEVTNGFILIDTGVKQKRDVLLEQLQHKGCTAGNLQMVIITHGDYDHTGNAAYLKREFNATIAIHNGDRPMLAEGDMFANRENGNALLRWMAPKLMGFGKAQCVEPDVLLADEQSLLDYGWDAMVIHLPGHSLGSIGILTADNILFCGDTLDNRSSPAPTSLIGNPSVFQAGVDRIIDLNPPIIYPGHGKAFTVQEFQDNMARK